MKYAVLLIKGKQYKVAEGEVLKVDHLAGEPDFKTLLLVDDSNVLVGNPFLKNVKVELKVLREVKGDKIYVQKFKAKSRYRKKIGMRPLYSELQIENISISK